MALKLEMKILLVEDFNVTRKLEIKALNKIGFSNIMEAENGETAVRKLKEEKDIELIISDWNMPEMNGFDFLKWVRSEKEYQHIPFIMVTAQAEKKDASKVIEAGASHFITKPFTYEELKRILEKVFSVQQKERGDIPHKTASGKIRLKVGHIQITDHLVLGVLEHMIGRGTYSPKHFELETVCMSGWNPVQKSLEKAEVDAAFIMAPIAMDLFSYGVPIKLVLLAHKNGSICVRNKRGGSNVTFPEYCKNKMFYIPHVLSVHHMLSDMLFREIGLNAGLVGTEGLDVIFEVIPPVMMPEFLGESEDACGFLVAQPIGTKTIFDGNAELLFLSGEMWEHHPCCIVAMQDKIVESYPDAVHEFTDLLVKCGQFIENNPEEAAEIAIEFLDPEEELQLTVPVLKSVLSEHHGIRTHDLYPSLEDLDKIQRYMVQKMGIGTMIDLEKFVDPRFADAVCPEPEGGRKPSFFHDPKLIVDKFS
ncbi:MAG: response regulator [Desulfococcaceae bacterium]|jgi:DNA-binding response OmpR family regulator|nr:response regulator [Desulfococcaceae bacterium]